MRGRQTTVRQCHQVHVPGGGCGAPPGQFQEQTTGIGSGAVSQTTQTVLEGVRTDDVRWPSSLWAALALLVRLRRAGTAN